MASKAAALVTGASRGIGLALCRRLAEDGARTVFAACRRPEEASELTALASSRPNVRPVRLDVLETDGFDEFARRIDDGAGGRGLGLLVNNAGVSSKFTTLRYVRRDQMLDAYLVNVVGPVLLTKSLLPLLRGREGALVVNVSSELGSVSANRTGGLYPYRCSKAALNAATRSMSIDLRRDGVSAVAVHPGWVRTDMGGPRAPLGPDECAARLAATLATLGEPHSGLLVDLDGRELPW